MKQTPFHESQRYNPIRSVDWRWQRAMRLTENHKRLTHRLDDNETLAAAKFIRASGRCQTDKENARLATKMPSVAAAQAIHVSEPARRIEIQMRLLAGQSPAEIAERLGCATASIDMYEALFYNVRDRLEATFYILGCAIGWQAITPSHKAMEAEAAIKMIAYFGGPVILDAILPLVFGNVAECWPDESPGPCGATTGLSALGGKSPGGLHTATLSAQYRDRDQPAELPADIKDRLTMLLAVMQHRLSATSFLQIALLQAVLERTLPNPRLGVSLLNDVGLDMPRFSGEPGPDAKVCNSTEMPPNLSERLEDAISRCVA